MKGWVIRVTRKGKLTVCFLFMICLAGIAAWGNSYLTQDPRLSPVDGAGNNVIFLYFDGSVADNYCLGREWRRIPDDISLAAGGDENLLTLVRFTLEELIGGPNPGSKLAATIPTGTKILAIDINEGIVSVDFSAELEQNHWGGSIREEITVFSITNTLTQFNGIEGVEIKIEGNSDGSIAGHIPLNQVFAHNWHLNQ
ncbi:MAG: GerMN domain-containing protein [bacterium]|jgi:hypothetical protein